MREQSKQLSTDAATILELFREWADLPADTSWVLLRPVLRLLLWLLPEHLQVVTEADRAPELSVAASSGFAKGKQCLDGRWKNSFVSSFAADVATVSVGLCR
jgi:hypothetical protein